MNSVRDPDDLSNWFERLPFQSPGRFRIVTAQETDQYDY